MFSTPLKSNLNSKVVTVRSKCCLLYFYCWDVMNVVSVCACAYSVCVCVWLLLNNIHCLFLSLSGSGTDLLIHTCACFISVAR